MNCLLRMERDSLEACIYNINRMMQTENKQEYEQARDNYTVIIYHNFNPSFELRIKSKDLEEEIQWK